MKVHLFGLPESAHIRLKDESGNWSGAVSAPHEFRSTPILSNRLGQVTGSDIKELVKAVGEGFTHLVLVGIREWQKISSRLKFDCRVHVVRISGPIRDVGWPDLREDLQAIVTMDESWLSRLSPTDLRHALLLPPPVFATNRDTVNFWQKCDVYSPELFVGGEEVLAEVERHHRRPDSKGVKSWLDSKKMRYRFDHSPHGRSHADRTGEKSYRFCFEIPPGFHYDVTDDSGRMFSIEIDGRSQRVSHCNITPWGAVRRGKQS
jgi:hypothetical protein